MDSTISRGSRGVQLGDWKLQLDWKLKLESIEERKHPRSRSEIQPTGLFNKEITAWPEQNRALRIAPPRAVSVVSACFR
jgi:hypothetical protein